MKLILTESQIKKMIFESINKKYLDKLLDKISSKGIESLSDSEKDSLMKMSQEHNDWVDDPDDIDPNKIKKQKINKDHTFGGSSFAGHQDDDMRGIDKDDYRDYEDLLDEPSEEDQPNVGYQYDLFMSLFPAPISKDINGKTWNFDITEDDENENFVSLKIWNGDTEILVVPFWNNNQIIFKCNRTGKTINSVVNKIPENEEEMKQFIKSFIYQIIPSSLNQIIQTITK